MLRDSSKGTSGKDKSAYVLVPKRESQLLSDKSVASPATPGSDALEEESGMVYYRILGHFLCMHLSVYLCVSMALYCSSEW